MGARPDADEEGRRWGRALVWFMRLTALAWIGLGLHYWGQILGPGEGGPTSSGFLEMTLARQTGVVFFATLDFIAAIGLWLIAPWGGVVWLFTALSEIVAAAVLPQLKLGLGPTVSLGLNTALVAVFFCSTLWRRASRTTIEGSEKSTFRIHP
ncbi:MAG: hypothetical protein HZY79_09565 [Rhodoblastus sp.]|nr:MAG: hypothetical protein HZY79_09565 [Rhodoblastus sp.]